MCRLLYLLALLAPVFLSGASVQKQVNNRASHVSSQQSVGGNWFAERSEQLSRNQPEDALTLSKQALTYFADNPEPKAHGRVLNATSYALYFLGRYGEAMQMARDAELLSEQYNLAEVRARALMLQGNVLQSIGEYPRAITKYQHAAGYYREAGNQLYEGYCYNNMGNTYKNAGQFQTALEYYQHYRRLAAGEDNLASAEKGTGQVFLELGEVEKAIGYFTKSLTLYRQDQDNLGVAMANNALGEALLIKDDISGAIALFDKAIDLSVQNNLQYTLFSSLILKSSALSRFGALDQALQLLLQARQTAQDMGSKANLSKVEYHLAGVYQKQEKLQLALETLKLAQQTEQQYMSERSATQLSVMQALFDSETKAAQIEQLEQQNQLLHLEQQVSQQSTANARLMAAMLFGALGLITLWAVHIFRERQRLSRLAEELKQARQQAEAAAQTKAAFLANMSHEIRTPINAVMGLSRLALDTGSSQERKEHLNKILDASNTLLRLVDDILDFSRIEAGKLHIDQIAMAPREVLQSAINMNAVQAHDKGLSFITDIDGNTPDRVISDPWRIQQILVNLISNAVKFTSQGHITVSVRKCNRVQDPGPMLLFSVTDTGIGMSQEQQQRLFQSFTQGDDSITRQYGGTGLGLAICKQLCQLMGGDIWVQSEVGKGSTFSFTLPLQLPLEPSSKAVDSKPAASTTSFEAPDLSGYSLLLVDDNSINLEVARGMLGKTGINVDIATNGLQAVDKLRQQPFDLILMDIQMPGLDGLSATQKIRQELGLDTPVIAMTAHAMASDRHKSHQAGMDDHLAKPIEPAQLYSKLQCYLAARKPVGHALQPKSQRPELAEVHSPRTIPEHIPASLAELSALDTSKALQRLAGNTSLYMKLIRSFYRDQRHTASRIRRLLANDEQSDLFRAIHSLKSSFAYIGAFELSQRCSTLENKLQQQQHCSDDILTLCQQLEALSDHLSPYCPELSKRESPLATTDFIVELKALIPLLKQSDLSVEERLTALQPDFTDNPLAEDFDRLLRSVQEVEFEQAVRLAEEMLSRLQADSTTAKGKDNTDRNSETQ
ncbi:tetratricopeptide repeat-containing hybrid sensor histidine kinase/response regulator [Lacimicrobium alkaliphilum]|uniref:histidine kinase n=1 Tax=Lacimicrobium alkaliphilum TaxID=1526571 RepID=A0ABQ1QXV5_9ALTE|nr:ATP-binding protein [Lacimicrobium alkaliphilum]GGD51197.1 hypothetical protein GCM10011357_03890 [Lacimicrobium alkaliphilum]